MTADRETRVRQRAHQIWLDEGSPEGRAEEHWARAEQEVAAAEAKPAKKPAAKSAAKTAGEAAATVAEKTAKAEKPAEKKPAAKSAAKTAGDAVAKPKRASKAKASA